MATVQILAFITLDGYLARRTTFPDLWEHPEKYGITRIREDALSRLDPDVSFISLTEWKYGHSGVYLAEATLETLPFTDSLLRFGMADELVLYVLPRFQGEGSRLFEVGSGFSLWKLAGTRSFHRDVCRLHYRRVVSG
ncbi:MAG TPA: deaminase [Parabacteroides merdae]|nr:deaminase [Parabacteroides merdae]